MSPFISTLSLCSTNLKPSIRSMPISCYCCQFAGSGNAGEVALVRAGPDVSERHLISFGYEVRGHVVQVEERRAGHGSHLLNPFKAGGKSG